MGRKVAFMADILDKTGVVISNRQLSDRLWIIDIKVDALGADLMPGQFVHMLIPGMEGHILRRPFSVFYVSEDGSVITILYQVVGFGSKHLTTVEAGMAVSLMGPIGHGWNAPEGVSSALLVAGGVGAAPLFLHAQELVASGVDVEVVMGAQSDKALVCEPKYSELLGHEPHLATDDGSRGHAGFVTDVVAGRIAEKQFDYVACCGPEPMMRIVSELTLNAGIPTYVSLEKRMACGIGACLACVCKSKEKDAHSNVNNKRICKDGPVFLSTEVEI